MTELQAHATADEPALEHGASPGRAGDGDRNGRGAILRMSGDERGAFTENYDGVAVMLGPDLEDAGLGQVAQEDAALDLRLRDLAVHLIAEVRMAGERCGFQVQKSIVPVGTV